MTQTRTKASFVINEADASRTIKFIVVSAFIFGAAFYLRGFKIQFFIAACIGTLLSFMMIANSFFQAEGIRRRQRNLREATSAKRIISTLAITHISELESLKESLYAGLVHYFAKGELIKRRGGYFFLNRLETLAILGSNAARSMRQGHIDTMRMYFLRDGIRKSIACLDRTKFGYLFVQFVLAYKEEKVHEEGCPVRTLPNELKFISEIFALLGVCESTKKTAQGFVFSANRKIRHVVQAAQGNEDCEKIKKIKEAVLIWNTCKDLPAEMKLKVEI